MLRARPSMKNIMLRNLAITQGNHNADRCLTTRVASTMSNLAHATGINRNDETILSDTDPRLLLGVRNLDMKKPGHERDVPIRHQQCSFSYQKALRGRSRGAVRGKKKNSLFGGREVKPDIVVR